jgi:hypothetical protein
MNSSDEATPAKAHLRAALQALAEHCEPLEGATLKDWYVITTHVLPDGEEVLSRFTRTGQPPWTDAGLLTFAAQEDEREWHEDDEALPGDTYT